MTYNQFSIIAELIQLNGEQGVTPRKKFYDRWRLWTEHLNGSAFVRTCPSGIALKDYGYVLMETGFVGKSDFNFDELAGGMGKSSCCILRICAGSLFRPVARCAKRSRIPVEKSGGGV